MKNLKKSKIPGFNSARSKEEKVIYEDNLKSARIGISDGKRELLDNLVNDFSNLPNKENFNPKKSKAIEQKQNKNNTVEVLGIKEHNKNIIYGNYVSNKNDDENKSKSFSSNDSEDQLEESMIHNPETYSQKPE